MEDQDIFENTPAEDTPQEPEAAVQEPAVELESQSAEPEVAQIPEEPQLLEKPKKNRKIVGQVIKTAVATVLILALVAGSCCATAWYLTRQWEIQRNNMDYELNKMGLVIKDLEAQIADNSFTGNGNSISGSNNATGDGLTPAQVYAQNYKSVVAITSVVKTTSFGQSSYSTSTGSGFIISEDGYVVTNFHVVEGGTSLAVTLYDGSEVAAELVGYDSANDVAVLKADADDLQAAELGSSDDLIVGDQVVAIGYPLSEMASASLTVGYVSGKDRTVNTEGTNINMLQTDAAINSGNSGGPLFNMKGEVVGITSAKMSGTTTSGASIEGTGYAIPIDDVVKKITDLAQFGYVTGAYLGVAVQDMTKTEADRYGLPMGAYVAEVTPGYCAEEAGVQARDIIVELGGYVVESINGLTRALEKLEPGETTTITVCRAGAYIKMDITLDERPIT